MATQLVPILIDTFYPFKTLSFSPSVTTPVEKLLPIVQDRLGFDGERRQLDAHLTTFSGRRLGSNELVSDLYTDSKDNNNNNRNGPLTLRLVVPLKGGKGGFGSQLRAAGGRMSSGHTTDNRSCRTLDGRRIQTKEEAKRLADYLASAPDREKAKKEQAREKLAALRKEIERLESHSGDGSRSNNKKAAASTSKLSEVQTVANEEEQDKEQGQGEEKGKGKGKQVENQESGNTSSKGTSPAPTITNVGKKRRFEDSAFIEQSREIVDNVKDAMAAAKLKRKQRKLAQNASKEGASTVAATS